MADREQTMVDARKLMRTFTSAPDARRRAQEVVSELRRCTDWSPGEAAELAALANWLQSSPPTSLLESQLRELMVRLGRN